jgi:hypothetical protein
MARSAKFSVEKTKDAVTFTEVLPFDPTVEGWAFLSACCCSVEFRRGKDLLSVEMQKGFMKLDREGIEIYAVPENHLEFQVKTL